MDGRVECHDPAFECEQERQGVVGHLLDRGIRDVCDEDAEPCRGVHVDVVDTDPATDEHAQVRQALERGSVEWLDRAGQDEVSTSAVGRDLVVRPQRGAPKLRPCGLDSPLLVADRPEPLGHDDDGPAAVVVRHHHARSVTGKRISPIESAATRMTSPGWIGPTPAGLPVAMRSPAWSGSTAEAMAIRPGMSTTRSCR